MKKLMSLLSAGIVYFCVATVLAQVALIATLWLKGALDESRWYRVLAALHGIDVVTLQAQLVANEKSPMAEQPAHAAKREAQTLKSLDLDLREMAIDKGLSDLLTLQTTVQTDQTRFQEITRSYDLQLQKQAEDEQSAAMLELQRTLEALKPAQTKEQLVKMWEDEARDDVAAVLTKMNVDKRKRVLAEFKQGADADLLAEILKMIRSGEPVASQIQATLDTLGQINRSE
ncbi:MAG: hypothetical protein FJ276_00660 [Planctomycetes bacterium]|nr:hypothetical protein [Planctomycetota bacterium]